MAGCCGNEVRFEGLSRRYRQVLWAVITINAVMFFVEMTAGVAAGSQALQADALDFFGDTLTYGISLWVLGRSVRVRSMAAIVKGISLGVMALWVFGSTVWQVLGPGVPQAAVMGAVGFAALLANLASVGLLMAYRNGDANVRSVWLCSRNDAIGNVVVMLAASGVWASQSGWPDILVALGMAGLFLWSSVTILRQALDEWREEAVAAE